MAQGVSLSFYNNWTFWAVVIAALALILSQLPPIHDLIKRTKVNMELYSRILITHKVGNPNVQLHIILNNVGGKVVRIREAIIVLKREGNVVAILPAQNYLQDPNDKTTVLFTPFSLKVRDDWMHLVNFLKYFSREDEKIYKSAEFKLKENIINRRELPGNKDNLVEAEPEYVQPFIDMHKAFFKWQPGEYEMNISIDAVPKKAGLQKNYRFTLFESDSEELRKSLDEYKFGDGIFWLSNRPKGVLVELVEA
jgi:hypothetical protein